MPVEQWLQAKHPGCAVTGLNPSCAVILRSQVPTVCQSLAASYHKHLL